MLPVTELTSKACLILKEIILPICCKQGNLGTGAMHCLGTYAHTKTDEFSEKFQTAFGPPPPHVQKIMLLLPKFMPL